MLPTDEPEKPKEAQEIKPVEPVIETANQPTEQDLQPEINTPTTVIQPGPKISKKKLFILIGVVILVVIIAGFAAFYSNKKSVNKSSTATPAQKTSTIAIPKAVPLTENALSEKPIPAIDLHFFKDNVKFFSKACDDSDSDCIKQSNEMAKAIKYYQLGKTKAGYKIYALVLPTMGEGGGEVYYAIERITGKFEILLQLDPSYNSSENTQQYRDDYINGLKSDLSSSTTLNTTDTINEFAFKKDVKIADQKLTTLQNYSIDFMPNGLTDIRGSFHGPVKTSPQKIGVDGDKTFYKVIVNDESDFQVVEIYATYAQLVSFQYFANGEIGSKTSPVSQDPAALKITWNKGENNQSVYFTGGAGCGTSGYVITKGVNKAQLVSIGKTSGGQTIYQISNSSPLSQELFDKDYAKGEFIDNESLKNLTIQQFMDKHAYFLTENGFGEYTIFQRDDMFMRGGCAKPVIYLYPSAPINVSIKVGANVVNSMPTYPKSVGWQNVWAQPNGLLYYQGLPYESLFWDGYANGPYPEITSGTVVRTENAPAIIRSQLVQQGLNNKEINDFLDYWTSRLPRQTYTRLTWFGTTQLDRLAPLTINPRPKTVVRTFLDFEGLDQPISLPPQHFVAPKRSGFTVVEWGGLLREGIH